MALPETLGELAAALAEAGMLAPGAVVEVGPTLTEEERRWSWKERRAARAREMGVEPGVVPPLGERRCRWCNRGVCKDSVTGEVSGCLSCGGTGIAGGVGQKAPPSAGPKVVRRRKLADGSVEETRRDKK